MMIIHSVVISSILYFIMVYVLNQSPMKAQTRSVLIGAFVLAYMILFGHGLPTKINKHIF
jgi:hypothetical protein